ncbi:hypothetical protein V6N13_122612 [Hibiscus sabdariffa]|uniref:Uncharacterized protein n=2 Tax=Hibiscus sabdariffa TaxID=183260 RepID=A0ABR2N6U9_9ROSI
MEIVDPMLDADPLNIEKMNTSEDWIIEETSTDNDSDAPVEIGTEHLPFIGCSKAGLPYRMEIIKNEQGVKNRTMKGEDPKDESTSKKKTRERQDGECMGNILIYELRTLREDD